MESPASLQAQAFVRTFQILNEDRRTEALQELLLSLDADEKLFLQNALKPLINHGIVTDDSRVHYVIVPIPALKPEMIADFVNHAYDAADDYFGHSDNINVMFVTFMHEGQVVQIDQNVLPPQSEECKQLVLRLGIKQNELYYDEESSDILLTAGICFKLDPTGIWKQPPEPALVPKEQQVGMPLAMTRYCVDICREGQHCFKNPNDGHHLKLLQNNQIKYHHLDVKIGTQVRRVVYLQPDPAQLGAI